MGLNFLYSINRLNEAAAFYNDFGFVGFCDVFSEQDIKVLRAGFEEGVAKGTISPNKDEIFGGNDAIFKSATFESYAKDNRILKIVNKLLGEAFELQHSKLNCKPSSTDKGAVKWHQDFPFFPHTNFDLIAVMIHFDDEDEDSGPLKVVPGSHKWGVLSHCAQGEFVYECTAPFNSSHAVKLIGQAGLVTVHHCLTMHASEANRNGRNRRNLIFEYRMQDSLQLAGVIWRCTGYQVMPLGSIKGTARFPNGERVEIRGVNGRLFDKFGRLASDK